MPHVGRHVIVLDSLLNSHVRLSIKLYWTKDYFQLLRWLNEVFSKWNTDYLRNRAVITCWKTKRMWVSQGNFGTKVAKVAKVMTSIGRYNIVLMYF